MEELEYRRKTEKEDKLKEEKEQIQKFQEEAAKEKPKVFNPEVFIELKDI